jgi:hypothetical protein
MEQLQKRFDQLNTRRIQIETQLEQEQKQLARLKQEAREKFGTDDLDELAAMLARMESENEQKRADYQRHLESIEAQLKAIDDQAAEP